MTQLTLDLTNDLPISKPRLEPYTAYRYWITINDVEYDLQDLFELLEELENHDAYISDSTVGKMLIELDVVTSCGSRSWAPKHGLNFKIFKQEIDKHYEDLYRTWFEFQNF